MPRKTRTVAAKQAAVSTDSQTDSSVDTLVAEAPAADTTTAQNGTGASKPTRTRAARASRAQVRVVDETPAPVETIEPEAPQFAVSTEETVAATQAAITGITRPSMDALMVFVNTEDPDAASKRDAARAELVTVFEALYAKSAELASIYGPGSAELNLATTAVTQLDADLDDIDLFDLFGLAIPAIVEAVAVLTNSTDVEERATARQTLRDRRNELRTSHDQAESIGLERYIKIVGEAIEAIEAAMTKYGFGENDDEAKEAALRAADVDAVPEIIECPFRVVELEGLPEDQTAIVVPEGGSLWTRYFMNSGRHSVTGCYVTERAPLELESQSKRPWKVTTTDQVTMLVKDLVTLRLTDGTIVVTTDGITAYLLCEEQDEFVLLKAQEVTQQLRVNLKERLDVEYSQTVAEVADTLYVLGFNSDTALIIEERRGTKQPPRIARVPKIVFDEEVAVLGQLRSFPAPKLGATLNRSHQERLQSMGQQGESQAQKTTPPQTSGTDRNPPAKTGRARSADKPAAEPTGSDQSGTASRTPTTLGEVLEPHQVTRLAAMGQQGQDRQPPARPVQTTAPRSVRSNTARSGSPVERRLVNKVVPKTPGIRIVTVPGAPEGHTTLIVEPGIEIDVFDYPSNMGIWTSVEGLGRGNGWRLTVMETVLVVIKAAARDSWLDNGRIVVNEVLFAREPLSRTFLRPTTRTEMILSRRIMDMLVDDGKLYYEKPDDLAIHADIEQMRVRAEEDELLAWMLDTDDNSGEGILRFAVTTVMQIEHAYRETGVRYTQIPLVDQSD